MEFDIIAILWAPIDYFIRGGLCMWPLLACSLGAIFIGYERYKYYKERKTGTKFVMDYEALMNRGDLAVARDLAEKNGGDGARLCVDIMDTHAEYGQRLQSVVFFKIDRIIGKMNEEVQDAKKRMENSIAEKKQKVITLLHSILRVREDPIPINEIFLDKVSKIEQSQQKLAVSNARYVVTRKLFRKMSDLKDCIESLLSPYK